MKSNLDGVKAPQSLRNVSQKSASKLRVGAALGLSAVAWMPSHALAQEEPVEELATVTVEDTAIDPNPNAQQGVPYKARTSGDDRHSRPLAETPQTITVLTRDQIDESGYTDLARILNAQPGITVGTGENGNAFGDRYIIRGQEARSDVFVDGLRDPGMTTRESFAIEQLEISKGPNSSFAGRGTSGGGINAITKQASTGFDFGKIGVGLGTDQHVRATLDVNHRFSDSLAIRANALYAYEEIPDRGPTDRKRKGLALSGLFTPTDDFSLTLDYYGLRAKDNPDLGGYLINRKPAANVPVYAQESDFVKSDVDTFTARLKYSFTPDIRVSNLTRYGTSDNGYVVTGARGATTVASGPGGTYPTITFSAHQGWQDVEYLANQTNLYVDANFLGMRHNMIFGVEYTDHKVRNGVYGVSNTGAFNCRTAGTGAANSYCGLGPDGRPVNGINTLLGRQIVKGTWDTDWGVETISSYFLDTIDFTDRLTVFAGARFDHFNFDLTTQNTGSLAQVHYDYKDSLWNGHAGITYDLGGGVIIYATAASAADINGGESDVGTSSGYGGTVIYNDQVAGAKPERSVNLELGTKLNLLDERLLLTAALFQTTKSDVMEGANYDSIGTFNTGKSRIRGVEFTVAGNITDAWSVQGGVTLMDSEVLESATAANAGKMLANFAKYSAQFQTKYQFTNKFSMGFAIKHESARYGGQPDTAAGFTNLGTGYIYSQPVPAYTVGDFFLNYHIVNNLEFRLNVNNITDEEYYLAVYRSGSFLYKGDARAVRGTLTFEF